MTSPDATVWRYGEPPPPQPEPQPDRIHGRRVLGLFGCCVLLGAALAPLAGWVWVTLANPPTVPLASDGGLYLGEQALNQQSGVTLWFFVVGVAFGAAAGLVVGWFGQRFGWPTVLAVLLLCVIGSLGSSYLGIQVFGPDAQAAAANATVGTPIQLDVAVDTWVAYLGWPIGGIVGVLTAIAFWRGSESSAPPPSSPTIYSPS